MKKNEIKKKEIKKSNVPPIIATIFSALIPGSGQFIVREFRRGLLLFSSFVTICGLLVWRIFLAGRRYLDIFEKINKAFYLEPVLRIITILLLVLYIWIIVDAFLCAKKRNNREKYNNPAVLFITLIVFFFLGWQIGEIDLISFFTRADEAVPTLSRVLWPWDRAIEYPEDYLIVKAEIQSPCSEVPFPEAEQIEEGESFIHVLPTCGDPSEIDGTQGTEYTITGFGLEPNIPVGIWWKDPINNVFRQRQEGEYVSVIADESGDFMVDIIMPYRLLPPVAGEGPKIWEVQARQLISLGKGQISQELKLTLEKMAETIIIGMMATFFGIIFALPLSFLAARNLMSENALTMGIYSIVRSILNIVRSIEPLIWAIIAVIVVGLGPFAGIIALTVHSMAALAKLYSEAIESIDPGPIEAVQATGANWLQTIGFAVVPQIIPPFVSFTVYRWDINIRMSTVIGFVGGGGIGFLLAQWIRLLDYRSAGMAVWFIAISVMILDYVSAEIRERFV